MKIEHAVENSLHLEYGGWALKERGGIASGFGREVGSLCGSPNSASLGMTEYSQIDLLGVRYKFSNFGANSATSEQIQQLRSRKDCGLVGQ